MKLIFKIFSYLLIGNLIFSQECEECVCEEPENVWFKVSYNENHRYGEILTIDMSAGAALYDESYIYLLVLEKNTGEELVIMFPIGYWSMKPIEELPKEEEEKFDLDEYLKQNRGKGVKIAKTITKVGE